MSLRKPLLIALLAASLGSIALPASARTEVGIFFNAPPPPPRNEAVPAPRRGYVWVPGYWDVRGHRHHWAKGHWERVRTGHYWHGPRWLQRDNGWYLDRGRWRRDSDRDGIPDNRDRHPYDPNRR